MLGDPELLDAVRRDDQLAVMDMASESADACTRDGLPWSCLAEAFRLGHRGCALRLMEAIPGLSPASRPCVLAGMLEGPMDDPVLFQRLLDRGAVLPLGGNQLRIEHECARLGHPRIVNALFKQGKLQASVIDHNGWTPFLLAIHAGDTATADVFLKHGAQINSRIRSDDRRSALHLALDCHDPIRVVTWLLAHGIDTSLTDGKGNTAAQVAEARGLHEIARKITEHDPAILHWNGQIARNVTDNPDSEGWRPFLRAIHAGNTAIAQVFLDQDAQINARIEWKDRRSALHLALEVNEEPERVVTWLLDRGIEIHLLDDKRRTAAELAKDRGQDTLARLITEHGGAGGPGWHQDAVNTGISGVISTYRDRAEGVAFAPRQSTHPFILGGDHDGFWRASPRKAKEHITWQQQHGGLYGRATIWLPFIERMLRGEDVRLDELLPLGKLVDESSNYYPDW